MRLGKKEIAAEISNGLLKQLDTAFMEKDFDLYADVLHVPHHIRTKLETFDIRTMEQLLACFEKYCAIADEFGAVRCERVLIDSQFRAKQRIEARYSVSYFDPNGALVTPSTFTTSILMLIHGKWRICGSDSNTKLVTGIGEAVEQAISRNVRAS